MTEPLSSDQAFIEKLTSIVIASLANENFGVENLSKLEGTIAEVAFRSGFGSPTYFIKCFYEHYGFSP